MVQWLVTTGKDYLAGTVILRREALPGERHIQQTELQY